MIKANFSIVKNVDIEDGSLQIDNIDEFFVIFSGTKIVKSSISKIEIIYGRVILCWMDGINEFFIILRNNNIYQLDKNNRISLNYIIDHPDIFVVLDSIEDVRTFAEL